MYILNIIFSIRRSPFAQTARLMLHSMSVIIPKYFVYFYFIFCFPMHTYLHTSRFICNVNSTTEVHFQQIILNIKEPQEPEIFKFLVLNFDV